MNIEAATNRYSPNSARAASVVMSAKGQKQTSDGTVVPQLAIKTI